VFEIKLNEPSLNIQYSTRLDSNTALLPSVKGLKQTVNGSCDHHLPFYMGACWKMIVVHGDMLEDDGSSWGENRKKLRVKQHVTVT